MTKGVLHPIEIKPVDETNNHLVRKIKVKPEQVGFIETVAECLKEAEQVSQWRPVAIYQENDIVGFAMYGSFGPNKDTWIDRIMIDERYQGQGLGKKAMKLLIARVTKEYQVDHVYLSVVEGNNIAYRFYKGLGFKFMDEKDENGEQLFKYTL